MRVVTYARVSTVGQEQLGQSLVNQERAFGQWLDRTGNERVEAYCEAASAKSIEGRAEFSRMIAEIQQRQIQCVVIDTLDRFTRSLRDGLNLLEQLRGHGVTLLPLDWHREHAIDVDNDRDWSDVVEEFTAAERERRKIAKRLKKSYAGRRDRGATTTNTPAFGLRKDGDRLYPSDDAWIVREVDRRFLALERPIDIVRWAQEASNGRSWTGRAGLNHMLKNDAYVAVGLRDPATGAALRALMKSRDQRHGMYRLHDHEFTGVFACGKCVALGVDPAAAVMGEQLMSDRAVMAPTLVCQGKYEHRPRHRKFCVRVHRIADAWASFLDDLRIEDRLVHWATTVDSSDATKKRRALTTRLAAVDQDEAKLRARRDAAFDMLSDPTPALAAQARKALVAVEQDEAMIHVKREALRGELGRLVGEPLSIDALRAAIAAYRDRYAEATLRERNALNRALVAAIGSPPIISRDRDDRWATTTVSWSAIGGAVQIREKDAAPSNAADHRAHWPGQLST